MTQFLNLKVITFCTAPLSDIHNTIRIEQPQWVLLKSIETLIYHEAHQSNKPLPSYKKWRVPNYSIRILLANLYIAITIPAFTSRERSELKKDLRSNRK